MRGHQEAQRAGIEHAKANGESYRGRKPSYNREQVTIVQDMLGQSTNIIAIAKATNLSRQTVYRIKVDPAAAEAALATWEKAVASRWARKRLGLCSWRCLARPEPRNRVQTPFAELRSSRLALSRIVLPWLSLIHI